MLAMQRCSMELCVFFFRRKTAYEMRISDWSSDVCSSDLQSRAARAHPGVEFVGGHRLAVLAHVEAPVLFAGGRGGGGRRWRGDGGRGNSMRTGAGRSDRRHARDQPTLDQKSGG